MPITSEYLVSKLTLSDKILSRRLDCIQDSLQSFLCQDHLLLSLVQVLQHLVLPSSGVVLAWDCFGTWVRACIPSIRLKQQLAKLRYERHAVGHVHCCVPE